MDENTYIIYLRCCLTAFLILRTPYDYRKNLTFISKTNLLSSANTVISKDGLGPFAMLVGLFVLPFFWRPERFEFASLALPDFIRLAGLVFGVAAVLLFFLTHHYLGRNFSGTLELREEHQLVTDGIYSYVRHPMYAAFYLLGISCLLLSANWFIGLSAILGSHLIYSLRVEKEEALLESEFGDEYLDYVKRTGRLLPKI